MSIMTSQSVCTVILCAVQAACLSVGRCGTAGLSGAVCGLSTGALTLPGWLWAGASVLGVSSGRYGLGQLLLLLTTNLCCIAGVSTTF